MIAFEDVIYESFRKEKLWADITGKEIKHISDLMPNQDKLGYGIKAITPSKEAKKSLNAGCNLVLYCAGNTKDNFKLIKSLPYIDKFTSKKTSELYKFLG